MSLVIEALAGAEVRKPVPLQRSRLQSFKGFAQLSEQALEYDESRHDQRDGFRGGARDSGGCATVSQPPCALVCVL